MPVIINEFEIVVEPSPPQLNNDQQPASQVAELTPQAIEQIIDYFMKRRARLLAD